MKRLRNIFMLLALSLLVACCNEENKFELKRGDILFQDLDCGIYCESIETVTQGIDGAHLSHCGIVSTTEEGDYVVIEAISKGVCETELDTFLNRSFDQNNKPKVLVGRIKNWGFEEIESAVKNALLLLNKPYDNIYIANDDSYYCSELVYTAYLEKGEPIFSLKPMTFVDPSTGNTFPAWKQYFDDFGILVPEGKPGLNPGSISLSERVEIVHAFGRPEEYQLK